MMLSLTVPMVDIYARVGESVHVVGQSGMKALFRWRFSSFSVAPKYEWKRESTATAVAVLATLL